MSGRRYNPFGNQIKRRDAMNNGKDRKGIQIPIPNIGGGLQQQISMQDTTEQPCLKCQGQLFDSAVKLRVFSRMNLKNPTGQDVLIKIEVYICRACGHEHGQSVFQEGQGA